LAIKILENIVPHERVKLVEVEFGVAAGETPGVACPSTSLTAFATLRMTKGGYNRRDLLIGWVAGDDFDHILKSGGSMPIE
jgi:hypothetical protein